MENGGLETKIKKSLKDFKAVRANISAVGVKHPPNGWLSELCLGSVFAGFAQLLLGAS